MSEMYFIAIVAPPEVNEMVLKWKNFMKDHFECTVALRSPAHITLIPPFWMDSTQEQGLAGHLTEFAAKQTQFEIALKDFSAFKPKVIFVEVVPNPTLNQLRADLEKWLLTPNLYPIKPDPRPFHPHVTVANRDLHKRAFAEAWEIFSKKAVSVCWTVNSISLLKHDQKKWDVMHTSQYPK